MSLREEQETFHYKILIQIAETQAALDNPQWTKIEYLLKMCPQLPEKTEKPKPVTEIDALELDQIDDVQFTDRIDDRYLLQDDAQEAVLAIGHFLFKSKGKFVDLLLPILMNILKQLPHCKWVKKPRVTADFFVYRLLTCLRDISENVENTSEQIASSFHVCLNECWNTIKSPEIKHFYESKRFNRVLYGIFKALSEGIPEMKKEHISTLFSLVQDFIIETQQNSEKKAMKTRLLRSMTVLAVRVLNQIVKLKNISEEYYAKSFAIASRNVSFDYFTKAKASASTAVIRLFGESVETVVQCAISLPKQYYKEVFNLLMNTLQSASQEQDTNEKAKNEEKKKYAATMCSSLIKGIEALCLKDLSHLLVATKAIRDYALQVENTDQRDEAIAVLCNILKVDFQKNTIYGTSQAINSIATTIYHNMNDEDGLNLKRVLMLVKIACEIDHPSVTDLILQVVSGQFSAKRRTGNIGELADLSGMLASIARLGHENSFIAIIDMVFGLYQNPNDKPHGTIISNFILRAMKVKNPKLRMELLSRTIQLFNTLGSQIQAKATDKEAIKDMAQHIAILLPPIAYQMKQANINVENPDPQFQTIFRRMWFYCVLFKFVDERATEWLPEQVEACQNIAKYAPILTSKKSYNFLETKHELNAIVEETTLKPSLLNELHERFTELIPSIGSKISRFLFENTIFLLSIYYLETLRVRTGSLKYFLLYLEDQSLFDDVEMYSCLKVVITEVFKKWMMIINSPSFDPNEKTQLIEDNTIHLFKNYCNRLESVRSVAYTCISNITKKFNYIFWSKRCIKVLLDLLNSIYEGCQVGKTTKMVSISIPDHPEVIILSANVSDREKILDQFTKLTVEWLKSALSYAPNVVRSALAQYELEFHQTHEGNMQHIGYALATKLSISKEYLNINDDGKIDRTPQKDERTGLSVLNEERNSIISQAVAVRTYHLGEVEALLTFAKMNYKSLENILITKLQDVLKEYRNIGKKMDMKECRQYMQMATAVMIEKSSLPLSLLQWIIWAPVYMFTEEALKSAVFCWKWLCTARPELELPLLTEIYHAWTYTINQRLGLFSGGKIEQKELAMNSNKKPSTKDSCLPHRVWINFLAERYQVLRASGKKIFVKILMSALKNPSILSTSRNSMGTRFRLCLLGTLVARNLGRNNPIIVQLREAVYACALQWFCLHPTWYDPKHRKMIEEDAHVVQELIVRLGTEKEDLKKKKKITPTTNEPENDEEEGLVREEDDVKSKNESTSPSNAPSITNSTLTKVSFSEKSIRQIELLLLLLHNELERMEIWKDPQDPDAGFSFQTTSDGIKQPTKNQWIQYVRTAFSFSPHLAIQLTRRFSNVEFIRAEVERFVRTNAADLTDIPEAVEFLITEENVRHNIPQFKYLLTWEPSKLVDALTFLNTPYVTNKLVAQYAIRILRKFPPEVVVFYLPQLTQCLRYDKTGILKNHLVSMCETSWVFCHQLIWTMRTELIDENELTPEEKSLLTPKDYELAAIAEDMIKAIDERLTGEQLRLYHEEFDFFDQVTVISGKLRELDKPARQQQLIVEARKLRSSITMDKNLYLPTNPELKITDMNPEKALTLKSAKKVPILIPFEVVQRDENGVELRRVYQNCIFKMGDDCRQDQLALQIIAMFKRIFDDANLPLYLYPYKVITTARECGIIECVPDTMSRHQVGALLEGDLFEYFVKKYGHVDSVSFQKARRNFIESMAAYSVVSYILAIKDRHNGNILLDSEGHVIHIDFGFLFDIQPGGRFGLEQFVDFKLTREMLMIMGEGIQTKTTVHSDAFNLFVDLVIKGYLAARDHMDSILKVVQVMLQSTLPCFTPNTMRNLKARFCADKTDKEAARIMRAKINSSYENIFSYWYDKYQELFEEIRM